MDVARTMVKTAHDSKKTIIAELINPCVDAFSTSQPLLFAAAAPAPTVSAAGRGRRNAR
jgi:hypothetical protein